MYYIQNIDAKKQPNIILIIADDLGTYLIMICTIFMSLLTFL